MNLYQDKFQDIQEFSDQYMAMRKVCNELGLKFSRCTNDAEQTLQTNTKADKEVKIYISTIQQSTSVISTKDTCTHNANTS